MNTISAVSTLLKPLETNSSLGLFLKDTCGCAISRLALARSKDEKKEIILSETSESATFYFAAPLLSKVFKEGFSKIEKNPELIKSAQILSTFSFVLPLIYSIPKIRNYITEKSTGKKDFIAVIGLKNENKHQENKNDDNIFKKTIKTMLSLFSMSSLLLLSCKNKKIYNKFEPLIRKFNKLLEFNKNSDLKLAHYAGLIYPISISGYLNSARDKYEKQENIRRFSVSVPLLLAGDKIIEKPIYKYFDKKFSTSNLKDNKILSYDEILKLPDNIKKQALKSKNFAFGLNFLISTIFVGLGVSLLNRIQTKKSYNKDNNLNKAE